MFKYCCCLPLRTGALVILTVETLALIILSLAFTTSTILPSFSLSVGAEITTANGTTNYTLIGHVIPVTDQLVSTLLVIICDVQLVINGIAILGAYKRNATYVFPWLVLHSIYLALAVKAYIALVLFVYLNLDFWLAVPPLTLGIVVMGLYGYFVWIVKSFYKEIKTARLIDCTNSAPH